MLSLHDSVVVWILSISVYHVYSKINKLTRLDGIQKYVTLLISGAMFVRTRNRKQILHYHANLTKKNIKNGKLIHYMFSIGLPVTLTNYLANERTQICVRENVNYKNIISCFLVWAIKRRPIHFKLKSTDLTFRLTIQQIVQKYRQWFDIIIKRFELECSISDNKCFFFFFFFFLFFFIFFDFFLCVDSKCYI
jgi:hypothetical protein